MNPIIKFQNENGLSPDGIIGKDTIKKMKVVFGIPSNSQIAHYLGQGHHETGGFKRIIENTNYSVERMLEIHRHDFDTNKDRVISEQEKKKALSIVGNPEKIANFVYANQNGNGNEASGDGWRNRGAGEIQVTGKRNYQLFEAWLRKNNIWKHGNQVLTAELLANEYFWESGLWYFTVNNLWSQAKYIDGQSILVISKVINQGSKTAKGNPNGLEDRIEKTNYYFKLANKN